MQLFNFNESNLEKFDVIDPFTIMPLWSTADYSAQLALLLNCPGLVFCQHFSCFNKKEDT